MGNWLKMMTPPPLACTRFGIWVLKGINKDYPVVTHHYLHQAQSTHTGLGHGHVISPARGQCVFHGVGHLHAYAIVSQYGITQPDDECLHWIYTFRLTRSTTFPSSS